MKIRLDEDDWLLYSRISDPNAGYGIEVDVPARTVERWDRVHEKFMEIQEEMKIAIRQAKLASKKERKK